MTSRPSSPSPAAPSSVDVSMGSEDEASFRMIPPVQYVPSRRILANSELSERMSLSSVEDESDLFEYSETESGSEGEEAENDTSSNKIFINGYFLCFDKVTTNGTLTWRCAYMDTCNAILHGNIFTREKEYIREHNHSVASDEEIELYGLDPLNMEQDMIYAVDIVPDEQELRNVRERSAARMVGARTSEMQNNTIAEIPNTSAESTGTHYMNASDSASVEEVVYNAIIAQDVPVSGELLQVNPPPSASLSGAHSNESPAMRIDNPNIANRRVHFEESFDVPPEIVRLFRPSKYKLPRTTYNPTTHLEFFLSMKYTFEEYHYTSVKINQRTVDNLTDALEQFCGQVCDEMVYLFVSRRIRIILNDEMLQDWENHQFFLLDIWPEDRWYFMCVGI